MLKQLTVNLKLHKWTPVWLLSCILGGFIMGGEIVCIVLRQGESENVWGTLGVIFGTIGAVGYLFLRFFTYPQEFMLALSMGRTRREFMLAWALETALWATASYVLLVLLSCIESGLYKALFPHAYGEFSMLSILTDWRVALLSIPAVVILSMFWGALYDRFGNNLFLVFSLLVGGGSIAISKVVRHITELDTPAGVALENAWGWLLNTPPLSWVGIVCAVLAVMAAITVGFGMKQRVRTWCPW